MNLYLPKLIDIDQSLSFEGNPLIFYGGLDKKELLFTAIRKAVRMEKIVAVCLPIRWASEGSWWRIAPAHTRVWVEGTESTELEETKKLIKEAAEALYRIVAPNPNAEIDDSHLTLPFLRDAGETYFASFYAIGENPTSNLLSQVESSMKHIVKKSKVLLIDLCVSWDTSMRDTDLIWGGLARLAGASVEVIFNLTLWGMDGAQVFLFCTGFDLRGYLAEK